jgi:nicotinamide riboside kinase
MNYFISEFLCILIYSVLDKKLTPKQLLKIAEGHLERENESILQAYKYLFTDTNAITTYMLALDYHGFAVPRLRQMATDIEKRYDLTFLCDIDIPYEDTWDRDGNEHRKQFQIQIEADLIERCIHYTLLSGTLAERIKKVKKVIGRYKKYESMGELFL